MIRFVIFVMCPQREEGAAVTADQWTSQGIIFLLAGFETSATTLGSLAYYLVSNTDVYQTLMDEVDKKLEEFKGEVNHETITEMHYLDACLKETLRMLPPVTRNDRMCYKDWTFNNITIKKGTRIGIPTYIVHHNPDFWPEPELFKPERFLKENAGIWIFKAEIKMVKLSAKNTFLNLSCSKNLYNNIFYI